MSTPPSFLLNITLVSKHPVMLCGRWGEAGMPRGSFPTFLPPPVPPQWLMETELFVNHSCYPANQFSSYGAKPTSARSERMAYSPHMV